MNEMVFQRAYMSQLDKEMQSSNNLSSNSILVVDDDPAQRLILKTALENKGYSVLEASSGEAAISIFEQQHPVMVLLDAVMPAMDGFETCRRIRSLEEGKDTLILMLTSLNDDESVNQAFDAGAVDFITKPIYWSVLFGRVGYLLKAKTNEKHIRQIEDKVRHAHKMESIGHLSNGMSHNFNNILGTVLGYTELLQNFYIKDEKSKQAQYLQQIYTSAKRASDLVSQMQMFTSKGISHPEVLMPSVLLDETIKMLRPSLPASIELHLQVEDNLPAMEIDPVQFQQMVLNLLINARDAMSDKGRIDIGLQKSEFRGLHCASCHYEINGEFIELVIRDTGTGIADYMLKKIFDPYYSGKPFGEASGMGLSVVHGIVHEYAGHILLETDPVQGTTFRILFPAASVELAIVEKENKIEDDEYLEASSASHILVVDDEQAIGAYEVEFLKTHGYNATYMSDPVKAIEAVTASPGEYDLVLTDKTMPGLDGMELAGAIMAVRADLPIILCTGYSASLPAIDLECIGIRAKLNKPVDGKELLRTIKTLLNKV